VARNCPKNSFQKASKAVDIQPKNLKLSVDWFDTFFDASSLLTEGSLSRRFDP